MTCEMLGITRDCKDKELAWKLAKHLYFSPDSGRALFQETNILPSYKPNWGLEEIHQKRPYWGDQRLGTIYSRYAEQVPPQYSSPFVELAKSEMNAIVAECVEFYEENGRRGFEAFVRERLKESGDIIRRKMERNPF